MQKIQGSCQNLANLALQDDGVESLLAGGGPLSRLEPSTSQASLDLDGSRKPRWESCSVDAGWPVPDYDIVGYFVPISEH